MRLMSLVALGAESASGEVAYDDVQQTLAVRSLAPAAASVTFAGPPSAVLITGDRALPLRGGACSVLWCVLGRDSIQPGRRRLLRW